MAGRMALSNGPGLYATLVACLAAVAVIGFHPSGAHAASPSPSPYDGGSAINQYVETIPSAAGGGPAGGSDSTPSAPRAHQTGAGAQAHASSGGSGFGGGAIAAVAVAAVVAAAAAFFGFHRFRQRDRDAIGWGSVRAKDSEA
jgi:hypothetical protein